MKINKWTGLILALLLVVGIFPLTAVPAFAEDTSVPPLKITVPTMWCGSTYGPGSNYVPAYISEGDDYKLAYPPLLLMEDENGYLGFNALSYNRTYNGGNTAYLALGVTYPDSIELTQSDITVANGTVHALVGVSVSSEGTLFASFVIKT